MKIKAKKIRIEFNNSPEGYWEASCEIGLEFDEAIRMITRAWEEHDASAEPLIKDEKVREIVRALFDVWKVECVKIDSNKYFLVTTIEAIGKGWKLEIPNININGVFKPTELCGEEDAPEPIEPTFVDLDERIKGKEEE